MNDIFLYIGGISLLAFPVAVLLWLIQKIRKKPTKKYSISCAVLFVSFMVFESIGVYLMCDHDFQVTATEQPTCAREGYTSYVCVLCGDEKIETTPIFEHNFVEVERFEATQENEGKITMECTVCGYQEFTVIPKMVVECSHVWSEPTCVNPKTCTLCGKNEGKPIGHSWNEATCKEAKKCSLCGETQGQPLGHTWSAATCVEPKRCIKCNVEEGTARGHDWNEATCVEPSTCTLCGATQGDAIGHQSGQWITVKEATVEATGLRECYCVACNQILDSEEIPVKEVVYSKNFGMTVEEFVTSFSDLTEGDYEVVSTENGDTVQWLGFLDISTGIDFSVDSSGVLTSISIDGRNMSEHGNNQVKVCLAVFRVLNPQFSESESIDEFKKATNSGGLEKIRGVRYLYTEMKSLDTLWFTVQIE